MSRSLKISCVAALCLALGACGELPRRVSGLEPCLGLPWWDILSDEHLGTVCPWEEGKTHPAEMPCEVQAFMGPSPKDPEHASTWLFSYDDQGNLSHLACPYDRNPFRGSGSPRASWKIAYERTPESLAMKRAHWSCGGEEVFKPEDATVYRYGPTHLPNAIERGPDEALSLQYSRVPGLTAQFRIDVQSSKGPREITIDGNGNVVSRTKAMNVTTMSHMTHGDGRPKRLVIEDGAGQPKTVVFKYEVDRLVEVIMRRPKGGHRTFERIALSYACEQAPACLGPAPQAATADSSSAQSPAGASAREVKAYGWSDAFRKHLDEKTGIAHSWDDALNGIAQEQVALRTQGEAAFDLGSLAVRGYRAPIRIERRVVASGDDLDGAFREFAGMDFWNAVRKKQLGLGIDRVDEGADQGTVLLVVVAASKGP